MNFFSTKGDGEITERFQLTRIVGLIAAIVAAGISGVFYFKRVFISDDFLLFLSTMQFATAFVGLLLGLVWIRSWTGRISMILSIFSIYCMITVNVGIH